MDARDSLGERKRRQREAARAAAPAPEPVRPRQVPAVLAAVLAGCLSAFGIAYAVTLLGRAAELTGLRWLVLFLTIATGAVSAAGLVLLAMRRRPAVAVAATGAGCGLLTALVLMVWSALPENATATSSAGGIGGAFVLLGVVTLIQTLRRDTRELMNGR